MVRRCCIMCGRRIPPKKFEAIFCSEVCKNRGADYRRLLKKEGWIKGVGK